MKKLFFGLILLGSNIVASEQVTYYKNDNGWKQITKQQADEEEANRLKINRYYTCESVERFNILGQTCTMACYSKVVTCSSSSAEIDPNQPSGPGVLPWNPGIIWGPISQPLQNLQPAQPTTEPVVLPAQIKLASTLKQILPSLTNDQATNLLNCLKNLGIEKILEGSKMYNPDRTSISSNIFNYCGFNLSSDDFNKLVEGLKDYSISRQAIMRYMVSTMPIVGPGGQPRVPTTPTPATSAPMVATPEVAATE